MHIRITFSLNYYKYIYSSHIPKYMIIYLDRNLKEEQKVNKNFKVK